MCWRCCVGVRLRRGSLLAWLLPLLLCCAAAARAAGPRYVTGQPYFQVQAGLAIGWKQPLLLYSTDPGDLSAYVNHAAADALVAAAADVWNVPVASITVGQGPALAEHVSGQNVYFGASGLQFPADVGSSNAAAIPLAVVYDTDGSVIDTLLGGGASAPSGCRQNGVIESVDAFDPGGYIAHAIIVINGRCTGAAPAAQLQLRYQLMRVFGRVLGLAWSQTNDNVFTGSPQPTPAQAQNWPIMHPIDILCGLYTYQCLPNPFTLRPDDLAAMVAVYPIRGNVAAGKQLSYAAAQGLGGRVYFPTGEGMAGVNVVVRRIAGNTTIPDAFYIASGVTGTYAVRGRSSSFVAADSSALGSQGDTDPSQQGRYLVPWWPITNGDPYDNRIVTTEAVNPLYAGEYSLGPYPAGNVQPSGSPLSWTSYYVGPDVDYLPLTASDAASSCGSGTDGTPNAPVAVASTGWWPGLICGFGHVSYVTAAVRPGRTFTVEVTALDAQGISTQGKLMPVMALFGPYDYPPYTLPSLGAVTSAFNGFTLGTTTLHASSGSATSIRLGIGDQRGDGRPDFSYQARLFYADDLAPAQVASSGGTITITGLGFRTGNAVTVNGVAATVTGWTANTIVATVPTAALAGATAGTAVDVTVTDRTSGATSTLTGALIYSGSAQARSMRLVTAPAGTLLAGDAAAVPFSVQLVGADGTTPVANTSVTFSATAGAAAFGACGGAAGCTVNTNANGLATTSITPGAPGTVTLKAASGTLSQTASFNAIAQASGMLVLSTPETPLRVGTTSNSPFSVQSVGPDGKTPLPYRAITFSAVQGAATFDACFASPCTVVSDWTGTAKVGVIAQSVGAVTLQARDGDVSQTVMIQALTNVGVLRVTSAPPAQFYLGTGVTFGVTLFQADGSTPAIGKLITFTAPSGISFGQCSTETCPINTDGNGYVAISLNAAAAGTYTVQAAYGSLTQSVTFTVITHQLHLKVLSVPADGSPTGAVAAVPFSVQVVMDDGVTPAPVAGHSIVLGGDAGAVAMSNCPFSVCEIYVGSDATATAWIIPQQPGLLNLNAVFAPLVASASFTAAGGTRSIKVLLQPGTAGAPIGAESDLGIQVLAPDGVTGIPGDLVTFRVLTGPYTFYGGMATASGGTAGNGAIYLAGIATGYGPVVIQVTDGYVTRLISFTAGAPAKVMKLVSAPASPATVGLAAAIPFSVQVFASDGVTPAPGDQVTFTLTGGAATFAGCASSPCVVTADAQGKAAVTVMPLAAGAVGLLASDGGVTQATSFTAVAAPDVLRVVSVPPNGSYTMVAAASPFAVQVLLADGITPVAGHSVSVSVSTGAATLVACAGAAGCVLTSNSNGMVSTAVTPGAAGTITLAAAVDLNTAVQAMVSASFTAIPRPDILRVVSAPSGSVGVGYAAATAFVVQVVQGDGVTPEPGKTVMFTASAGSVRFGVCAAAACSVVTAADGTASTMVTPLTAGAVTLVATTGTLAQTAFFTAIALPDVLRVTSAPASGGYAGVQAVLPFSLQVVLADGVTPAAGRSITLSLAYGSATFSACAGSPPCTLQTDSYGMLSTPVTPGSAGTITLLATDGTATATATFTTVARPDTLKLVSAPAGTLPTGVLTAPAFSVQLLAGDGTPDPGESVVFAATGAQLVGCSGTPCTVTTAADGSASVSVTPTTAGIVAVTATYGTLTQTATFTAYTRPDNLKLVSAPAGTLPTGVLAAPAFSVQLLAGDGTPDPGKSVVFTATGAQLVGCSGTPCTVTTAADGSASVSVTPTTAGIVTVTATYGTLTQTATFTAYIRPDILKLVSAPAGTLPTGVLAAPAFSVQLLAGDGTPDPGKSVVFTATGALLVGCSSTPCTVATASDGSASVSVTPITPGAVVLTATYGTLIQTATFTAYTRPDTLKLVSAPTGTQPTGLLAAPSFSVQLLAGDGTGDSGKAVVFTAAGAQLSGCSSTPCVVATASDGSASISVTPTGPGTVTLTASYGTLIQTSVFTAASRPDTMRLISAPAGSLPTGVLALPAFSVQLLLADGTPDPAKPIVFSAAGAQITGCSASPCTVTAGADGTAAITLTPTAAGDVTVTAAYGALIETVSFTAYVRPDTLQLISAPANGSATGTLAALPFAVQILAGDGTPGFGHTVTVSVTGGSATFAACSGASTCVLTADASGIASAGVAPGASGTITLLATDAQARVSASFTAVTNPDILQLVTAPSGTTYLGTAAATPFAVRLLAPDGTSPRAGATLAFTAVNATFAACASSLCTLTTDAAGIASSVVTPLAAGTVTLTASTGTLTQTAAFAAVANQYSLSSLSPTAYVAEGASAAVVLNLRAVQNGLAAASQVVQWTGATGLRPFTSVTTTDADGQSFQTAIAGPLAGGAQAQATACAWSTACTPFIALGISAADLRPAFTAGSSQTAAPYAPVTVLVTDLAGHPVAGASIQLYQTVTTYPSSCPSQGRCPAAPVLASLVTVATSGPDGLYTFAPLTVSGAATQTEIAVSTGTNGFATTTLTRQP